jgi:prevent-host-death family protein
MQRWVAKSEFKARALEYFRRIQRTGQPLVITERGRPVLEVVPYREASRRALRLLRGSVIRFERPTDPVGIEEWESLG